MARNKLNDTIVDMLHVIDKHYGGSTSDKDFDEANMLRGIMLNINFLSSAQSNTFDIGNAPDMVYLFDTTRKMFWKGNYHGYTYYIEEAGLYPLSYAERLVEDEIQDTKIVYFEL